MDIRPGNVSVSDPSLSTPHLDIQVEWRSGSARHLIIDSVVNIAIVSNSQRLELGAGQWNWPDEAMESGRQRDFHINYRLLLHPWQLAKMEQMRSGENLDLDLTFTTLSLRLEGQNEAPGSRKTHTRRVTVEKSRWVETFLAKFGHGRYELWELHFPEDPLHDDVSEERRLLEAAIHDYNVGQYADCYNDCRQLIERLRGRTAELQIGGVLNEGELARTLKAAENAFSLQLHPLGNEATRDDAEMAISLARALHRRIAAALRQKEIRGARVVAP